MFCIGWHVMHVGWCSVMLSNAFGTGVFCMMFEEYILWSWSYRVQQQQQKTDTLIMNHTHTHTKHLYNFGVRFIRDVSWVFLCLPLNHHTQSCLHVALFGVRSYGKCLTLINTQLVCFLCASPRNETKKAKCLAIKINDIICMAVFFVVFLHFFHHLFIL